MTGRPKRYPPNRAMEHRTMMKILSVSALGLALATAGLVPAASALAQSSNERALIVFGDDPCPRDTICVRAPESERYRIPRDLRGGPVTGPRNELWADRAKSLEYVGASGTASCSNSGAGSWTGCWSQMMKAARAERKAGTATAAPEE